MPAARGVGSAGWDREAVGFPSRASGTAPATDRRGGFNTSRCTCRPRLRCKEIGSYARAQELLRQGHGYLDGDGDGEACESLR